MLTLPPGLVVFVATHVVDGRKGIDGLSNEVRNALGEDPLSGSMYVFFSKRRDRVRVLYYDRDGYVLGNPFAGDLPWRVARAAHHAVRVCAEVLDGHDRIGTHVEALDRGGRAARTG